MSDVAQSSSTILSVSHLSTFFKIKDRVFPVVNDLSFDLKQGKTLAILGESGCGKSMTAFSLVKLLPRPPALEPKGQVLFEGVNLLDLSEEQLRGIRGKKIGMIFQDPMTALNPVLTIGFQLMEVVQEHLRLSNTHAMQRVMAMLHEVGIPKAKQRFFEYPHQLSGGMQQRVMIAMALICEPSVLIADEPTTALDVTIQKQVLQLMKTLQQKNGMAILLITHDMGVVAEVADEVVVMYASHAMEQGSLKEIFQHMSHPYTRGLFHSLPKRGTPRGQLQTIKGYVPALHSLPPGCPFAPRCKQAFDRCQEPLKFFSKSPGHLVKCFLYDSNEKKEDL